RDALHGVLSKKMVDSENLVLVQRTKNAGIQRACRVEAMTERLLDNYAAPEPMFAVLVIARIGELRFTELLYHGAEELIRDREIKDDVALSAVRLFNVVEDAAKFLVELGLCQITLDICHPVRKLLPQNLVDLVDIEL